MYTGAHREDHWFRLRKKTMSKIKAESSKNV